MAYREIVVCGSIDFIYSGGYIDIKSENVAGDRRGCAGGRKRLELGNANWRAAIRRGGTNQKLSNFGGGGARFRLSKLAGPSYSVHVNSIIGQASSGKPRRYSLKQESASCSGAQMLKRSVRYAQHPTSTAALSATRQSLPRRAIGSEIATAC